jgi:hypothetical protein
MTENIVLQPSIPVGKAAFVDGTTAGAPQSSSLRGR